MKETILKILQGLMAQPGITNTKQEILTEEWIINFLQQQPYFLAHPDLCGSLPVPGDPLQRCVAWGLVYCSEAKAESSTVVLLSHYDVVSVAPYGAAGALAFDSQKIEAWLKGRTLSGEVQTDLLSGEWIFGRGSCDMKAGIAVQLALLAERAAQVLAAEKEDVLPSVPGSILFLSVPDEESFSVGMRAAIPFLESLKKEHSLEYLLAVCSEPNRRLPHSEIQIVNTGSVGKLLPVVLIQGKLVQAGSYDEGINPLGLLSRLIAATEGDKEFMESEDEEKSAPPTWLYARDLKEGYDFSLPYRAVGYCSVLHFRRTPADTLNYFLKKIENLVRNPGFSVEVMTWDTLWEKAKQKKDFKSFCHTVNERANRLLQEKHKTYPEVTVWMMEQTLDFLQMDFPVVVVGFAPPFYPSVNSRDFVESERFSSYKQMIEKQMQVKFEPYFMGVSDCSYCGLSQSVDLSKYQLNTPLWGSFYEFDTEALKRLKIPFFLFGPWGKDLHQVGERVNRRSLTEEYPRVLRELIYGVWLTK